ECFCGFMMSIRFLSVGCCRFPASILAENSVLRLQKRAHASMEAWTDHLPRILWMSAFLQTARDPCDGLPQDCLLDDLFGPGSGTNRHQCGPGGQQGALRKLRRLVFFPRDEESKPVGIRFPLPQLLGTASAWRYGPAGHRAGLLAFHSHEP